MESKKKSKYDDLLDYKEEKSSAPYIYSDDMKKYIHDIRNFRCFSLETLKIMNSLPSKDILELLLTFNDMSKFYDSVFNDK